MYQKEIIYMSLFDNQIKTGNAGFLKVEKRQEKWGLDLQVKNVAGLNGTSLPIRLQNETGWQEVGPLVIKDGSSRWTGSVEGPVLRVEMRLSDSRRIKGESRSVQAKAPEIKRQPAPEAASVTEMAPAGETASVTGTAPVMAAAPAEKNRPASKNVSVPQSASVVDIRPEEEIPPIVDTQHMEKASAVSEALPETREKERITEFPQKEAGQKRPEPVLTTQERAPQPNLLNIRNKRAARVGNTPLYENKWEQLLSTYETLHPYGDNRVYVKLAPKDFVILRENYQHLVNNSFLLHGFYNYRYLILGKEKNFYLGVPGVFYEREKMVALMFGFEAFECEGGNAEEGKFGYYLRKVEI